MHLSNVVLPHPEGPSKTMKSPELISSEKSSNAVRRPYFLVKFLILRVVKIFPSV